MQNLKTSTAESTAVMRWQGIASYQTKPACSSPTTHWQVDQQRASTTWYTQIKSLSILLSSRTLTFSFMLHPVRYRPRRTSQQFFRLSPRNTDFFLLSHSSVSRREQESSSSGTSSSHQISARQHSLLEQFIALSFESAKGEGGGGVNGTMSANTGMIWL